MASSVSKLKAPLVDTCLSRVRSELDIDLASFDSSDPIEDVMDSVEVLEVLVIAAETGLDIMPTDAPGPATVGDLMSLFAQAARG